MTRLHNKPVRPNRAEKLTLAMLTKKLKQSVKRSTNQLGDVIRIVQPETVLRWHRELMRRKWTCCLIRDNDSKYTDSFDTVFESQGIRVIPTPLQAPNANAVAERWVRSIRQEILDQVLIINEAHLCRVLQKFLDYYNNRRPHQGLNQ